MICALLCFIVEGTNNAGAGAGAGADAGDAADAGGDGGGGGGDGGGGGGGGCGGGGGGGGGGDGYGDGDGDGDGDSSTRVIHMYADQIWRAWCFQPVELWTTMNLLSCHGPRPSNFINTIPLPCSLLALILAQGFVWQLQRAGGCFKNTHELLNLRAFKISMLFKNHFWNSTQNILPIHWKCGFYSQVKI